jgi:hypothetical protein
MLQETPPSLSPTPTPIPQLAEASKDGAANLPHFPLLLDSTLSMGTVGSGFGDFEDLGYLGEAELTSSSGATDNQDHYRQRLQ